MAQFRADISELKKVTRALEGLHKSAFPVAARQTLNDLAFDAKKSQLIKTANDVFTLRSKAFFRKFSRVDKAKGLVVGKMTSKMGMIGKETENFHEQEVGGSVERPVIPTDKARVSSNPAKRVRKKDYLSSKKSIKSNSIRNIRRSKKSQFVANAFYSKKNNLLLRHEDILFRVDRINKNSKGKIKIKMTPLYSVKGVRRVTVQETKFIEKTALKSWTKLNRFYAKNANQRFKKYIK